MPNLSTPIGDLRARYDVVVIGSGYGGAVVARRMADAAQERRRLGGAEFSVCLLERGLEVRPGEYPTSLVGAVRSAQADTRYGRIGRRTSLFDLRSNRELTVLVGCGLGGTSLINASVILKPKDLSDPAWPAHLVERWPKELQTRDALSGEFELVTKALGAMRVPPDVELDKVTRLIESSGEKQPEWDDHHPPIAVSFHTHINEFGVQQERCTLCGNCITGCNYSAKNTLIMNYLPAAANAGASIFCGMQVAAIEPARTPDGDWLVHTRVLDRAATVFGNPEIPIRAGMVFLASGALGSTELLLRSRDRYGLSLSPALGHHFSGNGDVIAFGYNVEKRVNGMGYGRRLPRDAAVGPTIAGMLDERDGKSRAMIQEAAVPGALGFLLRFVGPFIARLSRLGTTTGVAFSVRSLWHEVDSFLRGPHHGSLVRTQTFLGMSFDDGRGEMKLAGDRLRIVWHHAGSQPVFVGMAKRLTELTRRMHGAYVTNPIWSRLFGRRLVIAHPLGGCAISDRPRDGVVNPSGQVYRYHGGQDGTGASTAADVYRGLYVCDGAIMPTPLGTNPSLTIAALAQRIAERAVRTIPTTPADLPGIADTRLAARRTKAGVVGLRYAERLRGSMRLDGSDTRIELCMHMSIEDLEQQQHRAARAVAVIGVAHTPDLPGGPRRYTISEGTLNVLVDDGRQVDTKLLIYRLKLTPADHGTARSPEQGALWLHGHKIINFAACKRSVWKTATRLPFVIYGARPRGWTELQFPDGSDRIDLANGTTDRAEFLATEAVRQAGIIGVGLAGSNLADTIRLGASVKVIHEPRFLRRIAVAFRFQVLFIDALVQARVWGLRRTDRLDPLDRDVRGRPASDQGEEFRDERDLDQQRYLLTRFKGRSSEWRADRPAVMLIPGFSMSTYWFRAKTPGKNFTEFLQHHGYDVWLLDYRASDRLSASDGQFTLDDLATCDFPAAIKRVHDLADRPVQIVAHCVGSISLLMSLLSGNLSDHGIHSIVLSQAMAFIDQPFVNRLKATLHLAEVLRFIGFRPVITPDFDLRSSVAARLLDRLLYFYPSRERCKSGVCRRLLLIYGEANRHARLDRATHEMLYDMVDRGNLTTLAQLQRMAVHHRIVNAKGEDVYLHPDNGKNIGIPVTLLQGSLNNLFRRSGAHKTLAWLLENGGFDSTAERKKKFKLLEIPDYGHMDVFIGKDSARDVYPKVLEALRRMES